jgi:hypothetical protein
MRARRRRRCAAVPERAAEREPQELRGGERSRDREERGNIRGVAVDAWPIVLHDERAIRSDFGSHRSAGHSVAGVVDEFLGDQTTELVDRDARLLWQGRQVAEEGPVFVGEHQAPLLKIGAPSASLQRGPARRIFKGWLVVGIVGRLVGIGRQLNPLLSSERGQGDAHHARGVEVHPPLQQAH